MTIDISELAFIIAAGSSALLTPCGFPLLPGYIAYYLGAEISPGKALLAGLACTLGLLTTFLLVGILASIPGSVIIPYISLLELVAGLAIILLGLILLFDVKLPMFLVPLKAPHRSGILSIFIYGIIYGFASLSCAAPIFLAILFWAISSGGPLDVIVTFIFYAAGMGIPLMLTTILLSRAKRLTLDKLVQIAPWIQKGSGIALVIIGLYIVYVYYTNF